MDILKSFCTAFSLYSVIPVPTVRWERENMAYALCFFPLVGTVIGVLEVLWYWGAASFSVTPLLYSVVAVLLPVLVSGGIHLDGFVDTVDALSSHAPVERKLEILKDPHIGAFGAAGCTCLLLLQTALWYQVYTTPQLLALAVAGYTASRSLNALSIALFPCARTSGLVHTFASAASKNAVVGVCLLYLAAALAFAGYHCGMATAWAAVILLVYFLYHRRLCIRAFGGNTGDLAGFLSQNCETFCLVVAAVGGVLV